MNDGETIANLRGAAGTFVLSGILVFTILVVWMLLKILRPLLRYTLTRPAGTEHKFGRVSPLLVGIWSVAYSLIVFALLVQSVSQHWPYPQLLASGFSLKAWDNAMSNLPPLFASLLLAVASSCLSLFAVVAWLETQVPKNDRFVLALALVMLCVPALLVSLGQYRLLLLLDLTGTGSGLLLAHLLPVMAYVFVMLRGPYRGYDGRWQAVGLGLGAERFKFLRFVKWPMLKGPLLSAWAVGFSVSVVQFVPAQLAAAGRFSTLPMEAVTLSSGGNRALMSVYGLLMMLLPVIGFGLAAWFSKSRWRDA